MEGMEANEERSVDSWETRLVKEGRGVRRCRFVVGELVFVAFR